MRHLLLLVALAQSDAGISEEEADARVNASTLAPQLVLSTLICTVKQDEAESLAAIREEKANSKIAGVVDLRELKRLQDEVVEKRKLVKFYRGALKSARLKPLSCDGEEVEFFWSCLADEGKFDACQDPRMAAMRRMTNRFEEEAEQSLYPR